MLLREKAYGLILAQRRRGSGGAAVAQLAAPEEYGAHARQQQGVQDDGGFLPQQTEQAAWTQKKGAHAQGAAKTPHAGPEQRPVRSGGQVEEKYGEIDDVKAAVKIQDGQVELVMARIAQEKDRHIGQHEHA